MELTSIPHSVKHSWSLTGDWLHLRQVGNGHIHQSFFLEAEGGHFFLQLFNSSVFQQPAVVAANALAINGLVRHHDMALQVPELILTDEQEPFAVDQDGRFWRLQSWIEGAITAGEYPGSVSPFQVAEAFGRWTREINRLNPNELATPIPGFHELPVMWQRLQHAWNQADGERKYAAAQTFARLLEGADLLDRYQQLVARLPRRIIHGDAKADNLLVDPQTGEPRFVVDLDTVMPGYLWMDLGDLIRSLAASRPESDPDLEAVWIEEDRARQILEGYQTGLGDGLSSEERSTLAAGAEIILYEQALRFLSDFLVGDVYYPVDYADQNLVRAQNQLVLWESWRGRRVG